MTPLEMIIRRVRVAPADRAIDLGSTIRLRAAMRDYGQVRVTALRAGAGVQHREPVMTCPGSTLPW